MLRTALVFGFSSLSTTSFAHPGHIADIGQGHSHLDIIAVAVAAAMAVTWAIRSAKIS